MKLKEFVKHCIEEDVKNGDHSTLSCISTDKKGAAQLLVKDCGIIAGIEVAKEIFKIYDHTLTFKAIKSDGDLVSNGDIVFIVEGSFHAKIP